MVFGFEERITNNQDSVFLFIEKEVQAIGSIPLSELISSESPFKDISDLEILQIIFWLAEELKIHFTVNDHIIPPLQTKRMLIEKNDNKIFLVSNRQVDKQKFEQALDIGRSILPSLPDQVNQYAFSRHLVNALKDWQTKLKSYAPQAEQLFFPGEKEIKNSTILIARLLEKQDSYSIITSFMKYQSKIVQLSETVIKLTRFYTHNLSFWQMFIDRMAAFETSLKEIENDNTISIKYSRLSEILKSLAPYTLIAEAESLLPDVQAFHQCVEQKKMETMRSKAFDGVDKMVKKLISLFDTFKIDQEYRNNCLRGLRAWGKRIETCNDIDIITDLYNDAKDLFIDVIEEL
jgi:hypothetical protein